MVGFPENLAKPVGATPIALDGTQVITLTQGSTARRPHPPASGRAGCAAPTRWPVQKFTRNDPMIVRGSPSAMRFMPP